MKEKKRKKKILIIPEDTMTYAKYLSLKTGKFHDKSSSTETDSECIIYDRAQINNHILYANLGNDGNTKNISHKNNEEYYKKIFQNEDFECLYDIDNYNEVTKKFEDENNLIIIIPGIKLAKKINKKTQYEVGEVDGKKIVIQKPAYTEFIKYINKMPGTLPQNINYVVSHKYNIEDKEPKHRIQYIQNIYKEEMEIDYCPMNIDDFYSKLNKQTEGEIKIDLFVSHQSKDKDPYVDEYIQDYRKNNPRHLVWYDKDYFRVGVKSNSSYARNTIAHGIVNSKKIEVVMSNNYFDKLLKNIEENADYFGINYELALVANLKNMRNKNLESIKINMYDFSCDLIDKNDKIFDFNKYLEINSELKLEEIMFSNVETVFDKTVKIKKEEFKYMKDILK